MVKWRLVAHVMRGVHGKHLPQVSLAEDQHPVGHLGPHGQDDAFGEAVRLWTPRRDLDHLDARVRQDRVERSRDLTCAGSTMLHLPLTSND
jgi:hypothetical protein